jgi:hypothetical protein
MLKRTVLQTSTLAIVVAAVFAACSDNASVAPKPGIAKPSFSATVPFNNDGQCMYQDAVRAPTGTISGVKFGDDPATAANCSSNDVNIATADLKSFSIADAFGNFGPPVAYTGQAVMCPEGRAIQLTMAARLDETASSQRFDIGIWLATDGGDAKIGACKHFNLIAGGSVTNEDGDSCGDLNNSASVSSFELGTFNTVCEVNSDPTKATNSLHVGSCLGWTEPGANRVCPLPGVTGPDGFRFGTLPGNQSKCNCEGFDVPIVIQRTAKLEVTKSCSPVNDPGTFDLLIDNSTSVNGTVVGNDKTCGTGTGAQVLGAGTNTNPGAVHSFGEGDFTTANYTSAYACTNRSATGPQHVFTASGDAAATGSSLGPNQITLQPGEDVVCTYTNTRNTGTIELKKVWSGTPGQTTLNIGTIANGSDVKSQQTGANGGAPLTTGSQAVNTGTYFVSETGGLTNYSSSLACTDNGSSVTPGANNSVQVATGHAVICTFTNTRDQGSIELQKEWVGPGGQTTLNIGTTAGGAETKSQQTGAAGAAPLTTGAQTVNTGTYYVSETGGLTDYSSSLACTDNGSSVTPGANNSLLVAKNHTVVCKFTNSRKARLTVQKVVIGGGTQSFEFARNGTIFNLLNGGSVSTGFTLSPGTYTVCEDLLAVAWHAIASLDGTSVTLYNPDAQAQQDLGNRCFDINLQFGDDKTIVFTNSPPPGGDARTIGYWKNWSSCTGGQQYTKALQRGIWDKTLDGNLPQTVGLLTLQGAPGPNQPAAGCANAVNILDKRDLSGTKRASDPAYNMAAQLLAAMLNRHAGATAACNIDQLITDAQALLVQIGFTGTGASSLSGKNADPTLVAKANNFATLLDAYNNNNCTTYVP